MTEGVCNCQTCEMREEVITALVREFPKVKSKYSPLLALAQVQAFIINTMPRGEQQDAINDVNAQIELTLDRCRFRRTQRSN